MWKWGVSAVWVPLQASVGWLRARGSVCTLERVFFAPARLGFVFFFGVFPLVGHHSRN